MIADKHRRLEDHGSLLVRRAVLRDDWISEAIFEIRAAGQSQWDLQEWDLIIQELENSKLTVGEWLTLYT